jgi:hypothetical protein
VPALYPNLWARLIANTDEPDNGQSCWLWNGKNVCRFGYGRFTLRIPMLGGTPVNFTAHIAAYVCNQTTLQFESNDDFFLYYLEFRCSGLEIDHLCEMPSCINLDHLDPVTHSLNQLRAAERRSKRLLMARFPQ